MKGEVEVWRGDELLFVEPNMIVDGAGELLAEIMTVSPSLSSIQNTATSAILDASNYRIQAISFGTGSDAYDQNAHRFNYVKGVIQTFQNPWSKIPISGIVPVITTVSSVNRFVAPVTYVPEAGLPVYPNPEHTVLEPNIKMSAIVGGIAVSSVFPPNGQLTNFLPSAIASSMMAGTVFSSVVSANVVASLMGCFPDASSRIPSTSRYHKQFWNLNTEDDGSVYSLGQQVQVIGGFFNEASSMDVSGFVNMVMSSVPRSGYSMSSTASGLCLSADSNFSSNGVVEYSVSLASGDVGFANVYGGIYHLGLWTIDMQRSLQNGNTPPFTFRQLNNPRKYKLFCRKGISKSLTHTDTEATSNDLLIKWRLKFL